jgi:hypothetical protein
MGPIVDRSREHLTTTDAGIVMARRRLMRVARALAENGTPPPGTDPAEQRIRSVAVVLPADQPFVEGAREALIATPGMAPASV